MSTVASAKELGRLAANGGKPLIPTRREKLASAVQLLVKKAGVGSAIGGAFKKLLPYLVGGGAGALGGYLAGKGQPKKPEGYQPYAGSKPLWGQTDKRMFGRMGINPQKMQQQTSAMRDVGAGGAWRKAQNDERASLIRGMYSN